MHPENQVWVKILAEQQNHIHVRKSQAKRKSQRFVNTQYKTTFISFVLLQPGITLNIGESYCLGAGYCYQIILLPFAFSSAASAYNYFFKTTTLFSNFFKISTSYMFFRSKLGSFKFGSAFKVSRITFFVTREQRAIRMTQTF